MPETDVLLVDESTESTVNPQIYGKSADLLWIYKPESVEPTVYPRILCFLNPRIAVKSTFTSQDIRETSNVNITKEHLPRQVTPYILHICSLSDAVK